MIVYESIILQEIPTQFTAEMYFLLTDLRIMAVCRNLKGFYFNNDFLVFYSGDISCNIICYLFYCMLSITFMYC
jgi:hypothetical protein